MKINKLGYWEGIEAKQFHYHDPTLLEKLLLLVEEKLITSVLDLGCGKADYIRAFAEKGVRVKGYDGNPDTDKITDNLCTNLELQKDITDKITDSYDLVMSLEVGEHIPKLYENIFINNLAQLTTKWLIISWAIPLQAGHGHVNCRDNDYIIEKIESKVLSSSAYKLRFNPIITEELRNNSSFSWFKNTLMAFEKEVILF